MQCVSFFTDLSSFGKSAVESNPHLYGDETPRTPNAPVVDIYGSAPGVRAGGTGDATPGGMTLLYILGGVWLGGSALLMVALGLAAKRPTPHYESSSSELREAA